MAQQIVRCPYCMLSTVEKVIKSPNPNEPDKAQITVQGADELCREIRIDNALQNGNGDAVALKPGTEVEGTVEAPADGSAPQESIADKK